MVGKTSKPKEPSFLGKLYLRTYNLVQVLGWSYILYQLLLCDKKFSMTPHLWYSVKVPVLIFQNAAVLEVVNAMTGMVKSNPILTLFQVASRVIVVCGVLLATPDDYAASSPGLPLALFAWSVTEIIRYTYYFTNLIGYVPSIITTLRYTTFIALYPIGITGELLCIYAAQQYAAINPDTWSYTLPNEWNFTFSYRYLLIGIMLSYIPLFPQLYLHMFAQRKKVLGPKSTTQKTK